MCKEVVWCALKTGSRRRWLKKKRKKADERDFMFRKPVDNWFFCTIISVNLSSDSIFGNPFLLSDTAQCLNYTIKNNFVVMISGLMVSSRPSEKFMHTPCFVWTTYICCDVCSCQKIMIQSLKGLRLAPRRSPRRSGGNCLCSYQSLILHVQTLISGCDSSLIGRSLFGGTFLGLYPVVSSFWRCSLSRGQISRYGVAPSLEGAVNP